MHVIQKIFLKFKSIQMHFMYMYLFLCITNLHKFYKKIQEYIEFKAKYVNTMYTQYMLDLHPIIS